MNENLSLNVETCSVYCSEGACVQNHIHQQGVRNMQGDSSEILGAGNLHQIHIFKAIGRKRIRE